MKREPALYINIAAAVLGLLVTFAWSGLDDNKATAIVAVLTAGAAIITAMKTRPIAVSVFTGFISTVAVCAAGFGFEATQQQVGAVQLIAATVLTLVARGQITPTADPRPLYAPAARR